MIGFRRRGRREDCRALARVLQGYLDDELDAEQARRMRRHLDACRACGLSARTYTLIKDALARRRGDVDPVAVDRLTEFSRQLAGRGGR